VAGASSEQTLSVVSGLAKELKSAAYMTDRSVRLWRMPQEPTDEFHPLKTPG
jgi:hypothetical protein